MNGNIVGVPDAKLGPLASNGGPTQTVALMGSPAFNTGAAVAGVTTDQRGVVRPQNGVPDIGAYEFTGTVTESLVVTTTADEANATSDPAYGAGTSLREALNYAQLLGGAQTITFSPSLAGQTVILTRPWSSANTYESTSALSITGNITIQGLVDSGNQVMSLFVPEGAGLRHFLVNGGAALTLSNLTLSGGQALTSGYAYGGAIWNFGSLTVRNCAIIENIADAEGGAIQSWGDSPSLAIDNSTFSRNTTNGVASAIDTGSISNTFRHVTITDNTASNGTGNALVIYQHGLTMVNSIIAGNNNDGVGTVNGGSFTAQSTNNILGSGETGGLTNGVNGNLTGVPVAQLMLGSLDFNGGATLTHALQSGSIAIDAGVAIAGLTTDQRGIARPQGSAVDIGAFEARITVPTFTVTNIDSDLAAPAFDLASASGASPAGGSFAGPGVSGGNFDPAAAGTGVHTITYTVMSPDNIAGSGTFTITVRQAPAITSENGATFVVGTAGTFPVTVIGYPAPTLGVSGTLPDGVMFDGNSRTLSGTPAAGTGGVYSLQFTASNGVGTDAMQSFTLTVNEAPAFTSGNATTFTVGTNGNFSVTANGFPNPAVNLTNGTLPDGVTFSGGELHGTPAAGTGGIYDLVFTASNSAGSPTQNFTLTVNEAAALTNSDSTTFTAGTNGSFQLMASGFPATYTYSNVGNALPNGLILDASGLLSGTPATGTGGVYHLTFQVSNGIAPDGMQNFTLTVNEAPAITSDASATFTVGTAGTLTLSASGFPAPTFSETGPLPGGVTLSSSGVLSGTPDADTDGSYPITITASNGVGSDATQSFTLTVNPTTCTAPPPNMISWWAGDGNASDLVGGHDGTFAGGANSNNAGEVGNAFLFQGGNDVVTVPNSTAYDFGVNEFTIDTWVSFNSVSGSDVLVAHDEGTGFLNKWIFWLKDGNLAIHLDGPAVGGGVDITVPFSPATGLWYHVAVTRSANTYKFYVNGAQLGTDQTNTANFPSANAPLTLGQAESLAAMNGFLDEVQIFSRALTQQELAGIYYAGRFGVCAPSLQITSAVSRKTHGAAGTFDIDLPLTGAPGIECRDSAGNHTLVFTFSNAVVSGNASVISGTGNVSGSPTFAGKTMTVTLTGITNAQQIAIKLNSVTDSVAQVLPDVTVNMIALVGDTTGNKAVNASDISQIKLQSGTPVNGAIDTSNFREDVTVDGSINSSDVSMAKLNAGTGVP